MLAEALACIATFKTLTIASAAISSILIAYLLAPGLRVALASNVVCFLFQTKQGHDAQSGTKHTQGKDETTIARLQERLSRQEGELLLAATRNRVLTEENEKSQNGLFSMQKIMDALSENLSKAKATVAHWRDATIIHLKEQAVVTASMVGAQLPPTSTQNRAATEENEGYGSDHHFVQKAMTTVFHGLWKAREMVAQHNAEIERLEGQKTALESMVAELHPTLEKNRILTEENQKCRSEVDTLSKELSEARETVAQHSATITNLEQQKAELESEAAELTDRNRALTEETKKHEIDLSSKQKSVDTLSKELSKTRETVAQDHATIISLKQRKTELESGAAELTDRNRVLTEDAEKYGIDLLFKQKFVDALSKELSNATEKGVQDRATIVCLKQWKTELESEVAELNDRNRVLTEETKKYETDLLLKQEFADALSEKLLNAAKKGVQDRATIIDLKQWKAELESQTAELTDRNHVLIEETKKGAQDGAEIIGLQIWNMELESEVAALTEGNRLLREENEKHEAELISMKEDMDALSENLSRTRGPVARHESEATVTSLIPRNMNMVPKSVVSKARLLATNDGKLDLTEGLSEKYRMGLISMQRVVETLTVDLSKHDATIADLEKREEELKFALDLKTLEYNDLKQKLTRSEAELKKRTEEVADWNEFCKLPGRLESVSPSLIQIRRDAPDSKKPSLRSILAGKDHEIEKLQVKLSQCHSQLAVCSCNRVSPLLLPKQAERELPASKGRNVQTSIF
ncbi:hypothetical protein EST38_g8814 [Candolleomyces aberdarensis]|uniref:Uncharacterized protein n=1 Tax=Candolleomyces aberdarensis TaxID=2316362 RepID=A0A4Q2DBI3_9AGAR|nr:hypothetical protein EST38_g8814 [Candolleomyces aberdarensis]